MAILYHRLLEIHLLLPAQRICKRFMGNSISIVIIAKGKIKRRYRFTTKA
jgi:hypothetical protein